MALLELLEELKTGKVCSRVQSESGPTYQYKGWMYSTCHHSDKWIELNCCLRLWFLIFVSTAVLAPIQNKVAVISWEFCGSPVCPRARWHILSRYRQKGAVGRRFLELSLSDTYDKRQGCNFQIPTVIRTQGIRNKHTT